MRLIDADVLWMDVIHAMDYCDDILEIIEKSPTIEPERKKGKWILVTDSNGQHCICDHCGEWKYHQEQKFCGECGADMREEGEEPEADRPGVCKTDA